jgi:hypothetical protein
MYVNGKMVSAENSTNGDRGMKENGRGGKFKYNILDKL